MRTHQMDPRTRLLFANLPKAAKEEFRAWIRNLLQSFCFPCVPDADQREAIANAMTEMRMLLSGENEAEACERIGAEHHNNHLGARE